MKVAATILAGPGAESVIGEALRSARTRFDCAVVLLAGCDREATLEAIQAVNVAAIVEPCGDFANPESAQAHAVERARVFGYHQTIALELSATP